MHSALFVATPMDRQQDWNHFLESVESKLKQAKGVLRLAENVWLVNVTLSTAALGHLIAFAENKKVLYGLLPFEREPQWLPAALDPETMRVQNASE